MYRTNMGSGLAENGYMGVGDFLLTASVAQPYSFCLVLTQQGDLEFWYSAGNPQLGTGPSPRYSSMLADWGNEVFSAR